MAPTQNEGRTRQSSGPLRQRREHFSRFAECIREATRALRAAGLDGDLGHRGMGDPLLRSVELLLLADAVYLRCDVDTRREHRDALLNMVRWGVATSSRSSIIAACKNLGIA